MSGLTQGDHAVADSVLDPRQDTIVDSAGLRLPRGSRVPTTHGPSLVAEGTAAAAATRTPDEEEEQT
jgi:hypothetical protein